METLIPTPGALPARGPVAAARGRPVLDVVIPVHNEERDLEPCVRRLLAHLRGTFPYPFRVTIADNASRDGTAEIAAALQRDLPEVTAVRLPEKGRGRALRRVWSESDAPVLAYMDVDLSTDLAALLPLVAPLISGHSDLAIGSRLSPGSRVVRGPKREVISRAYNLILRGTLATRFSDAQCGFKAIRKDVAERLLPMVADTGWFFDTEMLVVAERAGLRIHEVPVDWVDDPDSRVDILATALADLRGIARLGRALARGRLSLATLHRADDPAAAGGVPPGPGPVVWIFAGSRRLASRLAALPNRASTAKYELRSGALPDGRHTTRPDPRRSKRQPLGGQLLRFCAVGAVSTLAYLLLFTGLREPVGAQAANALALLLTAVGNTAANRRLTFGVRGRARAAHHQARGLVVFLFGLALTSGSLAVLHALDPLPSRPVELTVLVAANLASTLARFLLFRAWVFARASRATPVAPTTEPRTTLR
ncbi:bifunctional glycosyltransferase family 2/GtrA family protein [Streptomyces litchfieldiae]|uniref:dolichyl-phosphate beta-glucosyltransferase n=1 Tax=Streptomyces litchfieldiae TaxID=3075543 RepID=A0ABU2MS53_9ACTN|nr:bifunctional glycosyltransferase family 2/GtrA family protein [Streptomyces sp. DSM 44938]MDT0344441.1 bifunctional glycosyltransferase family 2/GtrA family protein [Streptomyces sp. DSM 44938]